MRQKKVKQVVVIARVQWKRENTVCYIVRSDKPLKEGEYELKGLRKGDVTINGQVYGSVVRDGQRYALYNVVFRDGVCSGCCCSASGYGIQCYHKKGCMLLEGKRQAENTPVTSEVQTTETTQTVTETTSPIEDLDELVARLEQEYATAPVAAQKLPTATETVTNNLTSGQPPTADIGVMGSLSSNRQATTARTSIHPMTSVERTLPSVLRK